MNKDDKVINSDVTGFNNHNGTKTIWIKMELKQDGGVEFSTDDGAFGMTAFMSLHAFKEWHKDIGKIIYKE